MKFSDLPASVRRLFGDGSTVIDVKPVGLEGAAYKIILNDCTFRIVRYYFGHGWALSTL